MMEMTDENTVVFESRDGSRSARFRPRTPQDVPPDRACEAARERVRRVTPRREPNRGSYDERVGRS